MQGKLEASARERLIAAGKDLKDQLAVLEVQVDEVSLRSRGVRGGPQPEVLKSKAA